MRLNGFLKVRATSRGLRDRILVTPAELVRVLRAIAAERNGITVIPETPTQFARRGERERDEALRACAGE
jgi:hypothetical protein